MKNIKNSPQKEFERGLTLIELTVVMAILLTLLAISVTTVRGYHRWQAENAGTALLRSVYNAQRTYLSENPTVPVASVTAANIFPYLSETVDAPRDADGNVTALPIVTFEEVDYNVLVNVSPPTFNVDPSGDPNDGSWDLSGDGL